jgi:hypothetical protein
MFERKGKRITDAFFHNSLVALKERVEMIFTERHTIDDDDDVSFYHSIQCK